MTTTTTAMFYTDPKTWEFDQKGHSYYSDGLRKRFQLDAAISTTTDASEPAADIGYDVDDAKYQARVQRRLKSESLQKDVPEGWPKAVHGSLVWTKDSFETGNEYVYLLTDAEKTELLTALEQFKALELEGDQVSQENFYLPTLGPKLQQIRDDVYEGRGFAILRGLEPGRFTVEDLSVIYLGISSYIAERRGKQDQRGSMMMHAVKRINEFGGSQGNAEKPFHTDTVADCIGLLTRSMGGVGGRSILASAWTVYNELAATRPDLIHVLAEPNWPFDTFGRDPAHYKRALMYWQDGKLIASFSRRLLVGNWPHFSRTPGIPSLSEAQAEALDAVHFAAKKHQVFTEMETGDIRFINNMAVLHRREAFENDDKGSRHLMRLWLNNELMCWKLPYALRVAWARVFDDDERDQHWDIVPPAKDGVFLRVAGSCD